MASKKNKSENRKAYFKCYDEVKKKANKIKRLKRHVKNQPNDSQSKRVLKNLTKEV